MAPRVQLKDDREMKYDLIFIQWSNHSMNSKVGPNKDFRILNHQMNLAHSFAKKNSATDMRVTCFSWNTAHFLLISDPRR